METVVNNALALLASVFQSRATPCRARHTITVGDRALRVYNMQRTPTHNREASEDARQDLTHANFSVR